MILVIGGTGRVGREVVKQLAEKRAAARTFVHSPEKVVGIQQLGLEAVTGDLMNPGSVEAALRDVESVFLMTPPSQNEAELKRTVIDAAKNAGATSIVMLSGAGASHTSPISQAQQHAKADDYLKASGLTYTILQPFFFMQNFLNQAGAIKSQGAVYGNYRAGKLAMVDTRDIAAVAVACLTERRKESRTLVLTGGDAITHAQAAATLSGVLGKTINYVDVSAEQLVGTLTNIGVPQWLANDLAMLGEDIAGGQFSHTTDVVEVVAKKAPFTFEKFVRDHAEVFS